MTSLDLAIARKARFLETVSGLPVVFYVNPISSTVAFLATGDFVLDGIPGHPMIRSQLYEEDRK